VMMLEERERVVSELYGRVRFAYLEYHVNANHHGMEAM
jgi:hypothetical protein